MVANLVFLLSSWWLAVNVSYQGKGSLNSAGAINYHRYKRKIILFPFWNKVNTTWFIDKLGNRFFFQKFWTKLNACWRHGISVWLLKKAVLPINIRCYLKLSRSVRINVSQFQRAKKVVSDSPGLVDFAIEPVNFCPTGRWSFWGNSNNRINAYQTFFFSP